MHFDVLTTHLRWIKQFGLQLRPLDCLGDAITQEQPAVSLLKYDFQRVSYAVSNPDLLGATPVSYPQPLYPGIKISVSKRTMAPGRNVQVLFLNIVGLKNKESYGLLIFQEIVVNKLKKISFQNICCFHLKLS